jgi:ATP-binding cassette, subfamily A (ABC1), member 3
MISGATLLPFWLSSYLIDVIRSLISVAVAVIFVFVFDVDLPYSWVLFILFAFAIHPFTYFTSHLFSKEGVA